MSTTPKELARTYFDAWQQGDWERLRGILADDATFAGPMGTAADADACVAGLQGMAEMISRLEIRAMVADETDVITWYDLVVGDTTVPTANWSHVEDGTITRIRAAFDPRPILGP
ncbi:nuclear transport factor 2 family protein [Microlunatus ginsengisoli]|uniref:SnoaL-like domain-containing protein n=1 Tax=Microlunatus ginsengisoli TaxID=363863 RepID=A0ABP6ZRS4_9ACTN